MSGWDMLPDTAKALSAPVTKLIEVIAAGCGRLYGPTDIRRTAAAEGDALVLLEEARHRASDVAMRAARRALDVETRRQENLEQIVEQAKAALPDVVSPDPVHPDWTARFLREAADVSDDQMRTVWAKLLAGEVAEPGSYSLRTLSVLSNMAANEANLFNTLCKNSLRTKDTTELFLTLYGELADEWQNQGLTFESIKVLDAAGLLRLESIGLYVGPTNSFFLFAPQCMLHAKSDNALQIDVGNVYLTPAGIELAPLCEWDVPDSKIAAITRALTKSGFTVTRHEGTQVDAPPK